MGEITYPLPTSTTVQPLKFGNGYVISSTLYQACDYLSMLVLKLNHVSRRGPRFTVCCIWYKFIFTLCLWQSGSRVLVCMGIFISISRYDWSWRKINFSYLITTYSHTHICICMCVCVCVTELVYKRGSKPSTLSRKTITNGNDIQ